MQKNSILLQPLKIGKVELRNRLAVAPMCTNFCVDGYVTDRLIKYYEARAKGGFGLIIVEGTMVDDACQFSVGSAQLWSDAHIPGHKKVVEAIHKYGSKAFVQLNHNGRQLFPAQGSEWQCKGPSALISPMIDCPVTELTIPEIKKLVEAFGDACYRIMQCGYDGVELHGSHGYLIAEFMSYYANKRFDEYGGPIENRMRFPLEIIANIRKKCGYDFPIMFRMAVDEFVPDGRHVAETQVVARMLEEAGVDCIHLSSSTYESYTTYIPTPGMPYNTLAELSKQVKDVVDIPVAVVAHIIDPRLAENIITTGQADIAVMGRASIADPDLPTKYFEGRSAEIRKCLSCTQGCGTQVEHGLPCGCMTNPHVGYEWTNEDAPAEVKKNVVVVGGGPAGILAAEAAATKGHKVTLYEADEKLGGAFKTAPVPPMKGQFVNLLYWHINEIKKLGVEIKTGKEFTKEDYDNCKADTVIVATGTKPAVPCIKGIDGKNVVLATDYLAGKVRLRERIKNVAWDTGYVRDEKAWAEMHVVVAGGGLVGAELATLLTDQYYKVTIVEMQPQIAIDEEGRRRIMLMKMLKEDDVQMITNAKIEEITDHSVIITRNGKQEEILCDAVVNALGVTPETKLYDQIKDEANVVYVTTPDGKVPTNAVDAVRRGWEAGLNA